MKFLATLLLVSYLALVFADDDRDRSGYRFDDDEDRNPYSFSYSASRHYHGAPDREHREERGSDGVTRGVFRYVDPSLKVQEVIYTADANGFHVENAFVPEFTAEQIEARERHAQLFQQIAAEHAQIGADRGHEPVPYVEPTQYAAVPFDPSVLPQESEAVLEARRKHQELFDKITAQHERIAAERPFNPAEEETGGPFEYNFDTAFKNVAVQSGQAGRTSIDRTPGVFAPGEDHPDFQGYGVPLATFRDDITDEEALAQLEEEEFNHLMAHMAEAALHEDLVLRRTTLAAALRNAGAGVAGQAAGNLRGAQSAAFGAGGVRRNQAQRGQGTQLRGQTGGQQSLGSQQGVRATFSQTSGTGASAGAGQRGQGAAFNQQGTRGGAQGAAFSAGAGQRGQGAAFNQQGTRGGAQGAAFSAGAGQRGQSAAFNQQGTRGGAQGAAFSAGHGAGAQGGQGVRGASFSAGSGGSQHGGSQGAHGASFSAGSGGSQHGGSRGAHGASFSAGSASQSSFKQRGNIGGQSAQGSFVSTGGAGSNKIRGNVRGQGAQGASFSAQGGIRRGQGAHGASLSAGAGANRVGSQSSSFSHQSSFSSGHGSGPTKLSGAGATLGQHSVRGSQKFHQSFSSSQGAGHHGGVSGGHGARLNLHGSKRQGQKEYNYNKPQSHAGSHY